VVRSLDFNIDSNIFIALLAMFSTGFLGGLSPCTLPTVILIVAYVSGNTENSKKKSFILSLCFVLGIAFTLTLLGAFAGMVGKAFINTQLLNYIIVAILIFMGLWMLKVIDIQPKGKSPTKFTPKKGSGAIGAFLLGIPFGIAASPCTLPITASILAYSATKANPYLGATLMFVYAIGRSIPLIVIGTFTGLLKNLKALSKYQRIFEKLGGIIMILLALYFLWKA
jgi:cytochrome c biogenesis protein CcdA